MKSLTFTLAFIIILMRKNIEIHTKKHSIVDRDGLDEMDSFPISDVLTLPRDFKQQSRKRHDVQVDSHFHERDCLGDSSCTPYRNSRKSYKQQLFNPTNSIKNPETLNLNTDDNNGLIKAGPYKDFQNRGNVRKSTPLLCSAGVPCRKVDSRLEPPVSLNEKFNRRYKRSVLAKENRSDECEHTTDIVAFDSTYTLCLFLRNFKDEPILSDSWSSLNITLFGANNSSEEIRVNDLIVTFAIGYILGEDFTSVSGFVIDDNFYGTVYMRDTVHYLEPHDRKSKDMHVYGDGLKTLLHRHEVHAKPFAKAMRNGKSINESSSSQLPRGKICDLSLVADHLFFADVGEYDIEKTLVQMLWHVKEANALFHFKDFDDDGQSECLGLRVTEITIFKALNLLTGEYQVPEDFLKQFSRYNFEGYCLGILFTNRAFTELVLGLSWRGNYKPDGVGGICQTRVRIKSDKNAYSFNALFISLKSSQEERIPLRMGVLNLVHEIMHSFGAKHDPDAVEDPECTPKDNWINGRFLMSKYSNDGHKLNHEILSPCTKRLVVKNLLSPTRVSCLQSSTTSFCGDGLVQEGEQCDCGTTFQCIATQSCCVPPEGFNPKTSEKPCSFSMNRSKVCNT